MEIKKEKLAKTEYLTSESCAPKPALHKNSRRAESTSQTLTHTGKCEGGKAVEKRSGKAAEEKVKAEPTDENRRR